ncbi:peptidoglycan endopeptidase [Bombilactobacillus bombi]|uniref:C40 family peptidase n=1 Tax=Bombilactobacillus bombi TaxID=1303590 RepID=UPI000E57C7B5|nr:peptidoglycan endopeptidase [Bombilactobacillus bombi]
MNLRLSLPILAALGVCVGLTSVSTTTVFAQDIVVSHQENPEIAVTDKTVKTAEPIVVNAAAFAPQSAPVTTLAPVQTTTTTTTIFSNIDFEDVAADFSATDLTQTAQKYLGVPYVWGGSTPNGFDCSGLVQYTARENGINLPRTSQQQSTYGTYVPLSQIKPGDLLFWGDVGTAEHVAIYLGNGQYIHAPAPGQNVKVGKLQWFTPSFGRRLNNN